MTRHERWYRRLLRLFPADFRGEFGSSMTADFDDERRAAADSGGGAVARLWARTIAGAMRVGPREYASQMLADARLGLRLAARQPGAAVAAALVLALGIAGLTATFAVVDAFLLRPLPFADADALVHVWSTDRPTGHTELRSAWPDIEAWRRAPSIAGLAAFNYTEEDLQELDRPERIDVGRVSANVFDVLGAGPQLGRGFRPGEDRAGAAPVAVLSHGYWQRRYGGSPTAIGRSIRIGGRSHTIVGVMPRDFVFPLPLTSVWLPYAFGPEQFGYEQQSLQAVARLAPGASAAAALEELAAITSETARAHGADPSVRGVAFEPLRDALNFADEIFRIGGPILLGVSVLMLLVACANVSGVLLGRAVARAREVSVRAALGASRLRLFRQFMLEGAGIGLASVGLGLLLAAWKLHYIRLLLPLDLYRVGDVTVDWRAALAGVFAAGAAVALASFLPALRFGRADPAAVLRQEGAAATGSRQALRSHYVLLAAQVTLSVALVASAFAALDVVGDLSRRDPGFDGSRVMTAKFMLGEERAATAADISAFHDRLLAEVRALPGVESAALVNHLPLNHEVARIVYARPGDAPEPDGRRRTVIEVDVSPGYFATLGVALQEGRPFDPRDSRAGAPVSIVNRAFADRLWPGASPLGQDVELGMNGARVTVVGIVANARQAELVGEAEPILYRPLAQAPRRYARVLVRTAGRPAASGDAVRQAIWRVDATLPVTELRTLDDVVEEFLLPQRAIGIAMATSGGVGLLLMAIGLYGLLALVVGDRRREIGVRLALGASASDVLRAVVTPSVLVTAAGALAGLAMAVALTSLLASLLPGARMLDPFALGGSAAALLATAGLASYAPVRRAIRVNPVQSIRDV